MIGPNGDANVDAFTAMPLEFEDRDVEPLRIAAPAINGKKTSKFDLQGMFWKFVASGSAATSAEVLACLASDESVQIRRRVADNANTPNDALALLASDTTSAVRAAVARNPHTPVFILKNLANDDDVAVRYAIASNPEMPDAILLSLFLDPDPWVAERASHTLAA